MRATRLLLLTGLSLVLTAPAFSQGMGGGGGMCGGGPPPGGGKGKPASAPVDTRPAPAVIAVSQRLKGVLTLAGVARTLSHQNIPSDKPDMSGLYALRGAQIMLESVDIATTGAASLVADTRAYGMNSALLIDSGAQVLMTGGHIATLGQGATAAYVSGEGSALKLDGVALATQGTGAYGLEVRPGASLVASKVSVATESDHATALSVMGRGQPVRINDSQFVTEGPLSPVFSLSGDLEAERISARAGRADGLVINGQHRASFIDSRLSGDGYGVMIYEAPQDDGVPLSGPAGGMDRGGRGPGGGQPPAGERPRDAKPGMRPAMDMMGPPEDHAAALTFTGGHLSGRRAGFYVTNIRTRIKLDAVELSTASGVILKAAADQWGELGRNGGDATLTVSRQILTGDFVTDAISHIAVNLSDNSHLTGKTTRNTDVTLDASSRWTLTADASVGKLTGDPAQIDSQGHTLSYDKYRNPALNNQTLPLPGGGQLVPSGL
jgi:hypothetical protein